MIKNTLLTSIALLALALVASAAGNDRFPWLTDLTEARELAAEQDMPMLIVFRCEP
jgi:hypothetical protein